MRRSFSTRRVLVTGGAFLWLLAGAACATAVDAGYASDATEADGGPDGSTSGADARVGASAPRADGGSPALFVPNGNDADDPDPDPMPEADAATQGDRIAGGSADASADVVADASVDLSGDAGDDDVEPAAPPCLLLSEYLEAGTKKAVEVWNCGPSPLDLTAYVLALESNDATTPGAAIRLQGALGPNGVAVVCSPSFMGAACTWQSTVAEFNGDDRLGLYRAPGAGFDPRTAALVDAFGRLGIRPPRGVVSGAGPVALPWKATDLRRKKCDAYLALTDFDSRAYYRSMPADDLSNLGVAPELRCDPSR